MSVSPGFAPALESSLSSSESLISGVGSTVCAADIIEDVTELDTVQQPAVSLVAALWDFNLALHQLQLPVLQLHSEFRGVEGE